MADTHTLRGAVIVKYGEFNSAKNLMIMYLHIYYSVCRLQTMHI